MRHKRRLHRRELKRQRKIIVTSLFIVLLCLSFGYAAFSTNINLTAKGNVYKVSDKCYTTSDNGDGTVTITDYDEKCGSEISIPSIIKGHPVTKIGDVAFYKRKLTSITFPETLIYIGKSSFESNELTSLEIPSSVKTIGGFAFRHMNIHTLILHEGLQKIGTDAFQDNYITEINIPKSVTYLGGGSFVANSVTGDDAFIYDRNEDGSINYTKLNSYAGKDATGTQIPDTVTSLAPEAYYLVRYEEINIPSRIKIIPELCFNYTGARKITLPEGLEEIDAGAFGYTNAETIDIPSTVTFISNTAFSCYWEGCANTTLKTINVNKKSGSLGGTPWGATNATINWTGTN